MNEMNQGDIIESGRLVVCKGGGYLREGSGEDISKEVASGLRPE